MAKKCGTTLISSKRADFTDDISQEVFLNVFRGLSRYRGESSMQTWLFAITRNCAFNYRRSAFLRRVTLMDRVERRGDSPSAESEALGNRFTDEIWETVMCLPAKYRELLVLDAKYDLSVKEMAELTGLSVGTVKSRLSRARRKAAEAWKGDALYERI
ncbi:sigma-70 family RNA polymerase sigma factor [Paenibacillus sp. LHD-117]|uniref:RNA polymerase sigma factor n=1 Tax=Paenibacillus sp. LHD-117 TaxID=3071412 RepID=UPI0027E01F12|nr:sigma-70 family RNA polymerase sigma factor [Paenibacillus sp. LHD-117]MDQ6418821.1 sigma-70 family RNA polymerase sigma factor [Paenibacillus sp. LHD-117]